MLAVEMCGRLRDLCGAMVEVAIPLEGATPGALLASLARHAPALGPDIAAGRLRVCVNEVIANDMAVIRDTDRVALFPPVSGG